MMRGSIVTLRPARTDDRRAVYEWMAESDVTPSMMGPPLFLDVPIPSWQDFCADYELYFFDGSKPDAGRSFVIEVDGEGVGHVSYSQVELGARRAELDVWLRSETMCGRGYGSDALTTLMHYLQESLGLTRFILRPSQRNPRAIRAYEKAGFVIVQISATDHVEEYGPPDHADCVLMLKTIE